MNPFRKKCRLPRCRIYFEPTGGSKYKSAVYGLNGHRANFVIALSLGAYKHAI